MPDIVRLRYLGAHPLEVPVVGRTVKPDDLLDLPGTVLSAAADFTARGLDPAGHDDALVVEFGNPPQVRAFPLSAWRDETPSKPGKASKAEVSGDGDR